MRTRPFSIFVLAIPLLLTPGCLAVMNDDGQTGGEQVDGGDAGIPDPGGILGPDGTTDPDDTMGSGGGFGSGENPTPGSGGNLGDFDNTGGSDSGDGDSDGDGSGGSENTGGTSSGGTSSGGTSTGGTSTGGSDGGGGDPTLADQYPCNGNPASYHATAIKSGSTWTVQGGNSGASTTTDMKTAIEGAMGRLSNGRTTKQSVLVVGDGTVDANTRINLASYTVLNICGTIQVTGSGSGDNAALYARDRTHIDIPHVRITGNAVYGIFIRNANNIHFGEIVIAGAAGHGMRIDNHPSGGSFPKITGIRIDDADVRNTGGHGVETYGVDGLTIGTLILRSTVNAGLLLNNTTNAQIGLIDAIDAAYGSTYAAFRMANRNGRFPNGTYPTNIYVDELRSEGGGRGIFCVSESGGALIRKVNIQAAGVDPAVFIEDCYNVTLATEGGSVTRGSSTSDHRVRITARTTGGANGGPQFLGYSDQITIENLTVTNSPISESPCGGNNTVRNNTRINSGLSVCAGTDKGGN